MLLSHLLYFFYGSAIFCICFRLSGCTNLTAIILSHPYSLSCNCVILIFIFLRFVISIIDQPHYGKFSANLAMHSVTRQDTDFIVIISFTYALEG